MNRIVQSILQEIRFHSQGKDGFLVAIDGRCGSGKTTIANQVGKELGCPVIHMDDFFLRPEQRTQQRLEEPGGNVDRERFWQEVVVPLRQGGNVSYQAFDCKTQRLAERKQVFSYPVTIIEGSYCCHPQLRDVYDLRIFLTLDSEEQVCRIKAREGEEKLAQFQNRWIPLEEQYFLQCRVEDSCNLGSI